MPSSKNMPIDLLIKLHLSHDLKYGPFNVTPKLNRIVVGAHLIN
jgi:hypothetical protein